MGENLIIVSDTDRRVKALEEQVETLRREVEDLRRNPLGLEVSDEYGKEKLPVNSH